MMSVVYVPKIKNSRSEHQIAIAYLDVIVQFKMVRLQYHLRLVH